MPTIDNVLATLDSNRQIALDKLFELLRIRSVSTDPAFAGDCAAAAQWLQQELAGLGFVVAVHETAGRPLVLGHIRSTRRDVPHVLFYGHYDVQPADPLELWTSDPFSPQIVDGKIVARGASDDKGQLMTFVEACRAFVTNGGLPCDVTILLEGEEETGSPSLPAFMAANREALKADIMLVCDTGMWDAATPAVTTRLRGMVLEEVTLHAASRDLHSGMYGGPAINPIRVMARIIADLHDEKGGVALPGFYDGVEELPAEIATQWRDLKFDEAAFLREVGLSIPAGEEGRSVLEMVWSRPTAEVNGISAGYTGIGTKTVLPAQANAKFSFRLVGKQDPARIAETFREFVRARLPADCSAQFISHGASPAHQLPMASEALTRTRRALEAEWGRPAILAGSGGSIPIVGAFKRELKMEALMVGFALDDDRVHSPNEKYEVTSFHKGARSWARILAALAG